MEKNWTYDDLPKTCREADAAKPFRQILLTNPDIPNWLTDYFTLKEPALKQFSFPNVDMAGFRFGDPPTSLAYIFDINRLDDPTCPERPIIKELG